MTINHFSGVNPHLNSMLQTAGIDEQPSLWPAFHAAHVNHLADFLNMALPAHCTAYSERSLQRVAAEPSTRPVAVVIRAQERPQQLGRVVARIELLSPSNKLGGQDYSAYEGKRFEALQSGVTLVEIDYLHEATLLPTLPVYPDDPDAYPYLIIVSDPRPTWDEGKVAIYGVRVDERLPTITIPLLGNEQVALDLDAVYQNTFASRRYHNLVDYARDPLRFERYSADDQRRIRERIAALASA